MTDYPMQFGGPHKDVDGMLRSIDGCEQLADEVAELVELQRKAAAFDGMVKHGLKVYQLGKFPCVDDQFGRMIATSNGTELEAIEKAIRKLEKETA